MKGLTVIFTVFIIGLSAVNAQEKVNEFNKNGERTGEWVKYYDNGNVRYRGQFENGKEVGVFKFYSMISNSEPIIIKTFSKDSNIAKVAFYSTEGVLESNGEMDGENRVGLWVFYQKDGKTIVSEENYKNGLLDGESKTYYRNGKITETMFYKNGGLEGNLKRFSDEGILLDDLNYKNGKLSGLAKYYNTAGELTMTGYYENNERIGEWNYFENGKPAKEEDVKQK